MRELGAARSTALAAAAVGAGVLAGCGAASSAGTTSVPTLPPATTQLPGSGQTGNTIQVMESEFKIQLSATSVRAGTYSFVAHNIGSDTHALSVNGPGVANRTTGQILPSDSKSLTVTLKRGSYDVYCPVANHKMLGMDVHLTVT